MGSVITFAQQKGGAGKTTLLAGLAHWMMQRNKSVAIVDLDPQGSLSQWHGYGSVPELDLVETASYRVGGDLRDARKDHDLTLVDCPGSATALLEAAIRESDLVVVPCQASPVDVWATGAILKMCEAEKTPVQVVLNRVAPRGRAADDTQQALEDAGAQVMTTRIGNRVAFANGMARGSTVLGLSGQPRAHAELNAFAKELQSSLG